MRRRTLTREQVEQRVRAARQFPTRADAPITTIIAGCTITDANLVFGVIEACPWNIGTVIVGGAPGVDTLGELWARTNGHAVERFLADWGGRGAKAGPERNRQMADRARADNGGLILIWDGRSKGSGNMLLTAIFAGLWMHEHRTGPIP